MRQSVSVFDPDDGCREMVDLADLWLVACFVGVPALGVVAAVFHALMSRL